MRIKLNDEEISCIRKALSIAHYFYVKLRQKDLDPREPKVLHDLLVHCNEMVADIKDRSAPGDEWIGWEDLVKEHIKAWEDFRNKAEKVVHFPLCDCNLLDDPDDPDEVEADRNIERIANEWLKERESETNK